jgi:Phosphatidylglycerophosphate synthase
MLIPAFAWSYLSIADGEWSWWILIPAGILLLSGLTDALDGFIARKFNQITKLGLILDPLADKLTLAAVCFCLGLVRNIFLILFAVYFLKELTMLIGSLVFVRKKKLEVIPSNFLGKAATFVFYAFMLLAVLFPNLNIWILAAMLAATAVLVVSSMVVYGITYIKMQKQEK